jgi:hypothetical protein
MNIWKEIKVNEDAEDAEDAEDVEIKLEEWRDAELKEQI